MRRNYPFDAAAQVHVSAREWHKLQLGVSGFVGLCGVLRGDSGSGRPLWLQDLSGIAALTGLVLALVAVTLVATVAFPLVAVPSKPAAAARRLRLGIGVTFVAVALTALSMSVITLESSRPRGPDRAGQQVDRASDQVTVTTSSARHAACLAAPSGSARPRGQGRPRAGVRSTAWCR